MKRYKKLVLIKTRTIQTLASMTIIFLNYKVIVGTQVSPWCEEGSNLCISSALCSRVSPGGGKEGAVGIDSLKLVSNPILISSTDSI